MTLSATQRKWLSERVSTETIPPRSTIYHPNDDSESFHFILKGKVKVEVTSDSGSHLIKRICMTGDFFGSKGLFGESTFKEYARTLRSSITFLKMNNSDLHRLAEVNYEFAEKMMGMIWQELLFVEKRTVTLTELSARERFSNFLKEMTNREGEYDGKEWFFNSQLTQAEIGAYIGTGRQTVTEILNEFRTEGILRYEWGRFFVTNLEALG